MKLKNIIPFVLVILILSMNSCYDEKMEWGDPYTHPEGKDLPLELQEAISRYDVLNAYTNFTLGVGIDFGSYASNEAYWNIVNENFNQVTFGNEMKQSSLMNSSGVLSFTRIDEMLEELENTELTVYGHTLVWHNQQQASYVNGQIRRIAAAQRPAIVKGIFEQYITDVATHFKGKVLAWDVVNEPMNDSGTLNGGVENLQSTDVFYWQYYLGKDYAVTAFKLAREADPGAKLFINDYNLESVGGAKLDGLIKYVEYIESQGAVVDGIGTQLHMNINWSDTTGIKNMFERLATTNKLIKVTELDVCIDAGSGTDSPPGSPVSPTAAQYAQQAELYRYVADMYTKIIPADKQYGITIWGVSDNEDEHKYWRKNDAPCLWDANYARKHAYKGLADGLAGKDVSAEFSGELQY